MVIQTRRNDGTQQAAVPPITNPLAQVAPNLPPEITQSAGIPMPEATYEARRANAEAPLPENPYGQGVPEMMGGVPPQEDDGSFYGGDPGAGPNQGPVPYTDAVKSSYWEGGVGRLNKPILPDELAERINDDRQIANKAAGIFAMDWRDENELKNNLKTVGAHHVGTLYRSAGDIADALGKQKVTDESERGVYTDNSFNKIKNTYGVSPTVVANSAMIAASLVMPIVAGARVGGGETKEQVDAIDMLNAMLDGDFSLGSANQVDGGIEKNLFRRMLGAAGNKLLGRANNIVDENGAPIDQSTVSKNRLTDDELGAMLSNAVTGDTSGTTAGLFSVNKKDDGTESVVINPIRGHDLYMASKDMAAEYSEAMLSTATFAPVSDIGRSRTAARNITAHKEHPEVQDLQEVERIIGSTPSMVSGQRSWLAAAMFNLGMEHHNTGGVNTTKHAMLGMPAKPLEGDEDGIKKYNKVLKTKASIVGKLLKGYAKYVARGLPVFMEAWSDRTVHRMYDKPNDLTPQRHTMTRAVLSSNESPRIFRSNLHKTPITKQVAYSWWEDVGSFMRQKRDDYHFKSEHQDEMNFLFTAAHALDLGKFVDSTRETASYLPPDLIRLLTPERMALFADFGYKLKQIIPQSKSQIVADLTDPSKMQLTAEQRSVIQDLVGRVGRKEWGFYAQAAMDLDSYLAAKENGTAFVPKLLTAIDLNSAGRTFLAMDIGNMDVLSHVGVHWDYKYDQEYQNTLPGGSPRKYFLDLATSRGVRKAFNDSDPDERQFWEKILVDYTDKYGKDFMDDFGKAVLMTTDYGKAYMFHQDEAKSLLDEYEDFSKEVMAYYGNNLKDSINALNSIYKGTLETAGDLWQQDLPKTIVKLLAMYGKTPKPKGMFGEDMFIGGFIEQSMNKSIRIEGLDNDEIVQLTKRVYSELAKAKYKGGKDLDGNPLTEPGEGTAAINQMGPILGQYRESALIAMTLLYINKGKAAKDILFTRPVFDNLILGPSSMAQFVYVANNIIAPKIFEWDIQADLVKDFQEQMKKGLAEVSKEGKIDIGKNGKYYGTLVSLDREYEYIKDSDPKDLSPLKRDFLKVLLDPISGYVPPDATASDRNNVVITAQQHMRLVAAFNKLKMSTISNGAEVSKLKLWMDVGLQRKKLAMRRMHELARKGFLSFMT